MQTFDGTATKVLEEEQNTLPVLGKLVRVRIMFFLLPRLALAKLVQYNIANEGAYDWFISQQQLAFSDAIYDQLVVGQVFWHSVLSQLFKIANQNYGANI